MRFQEKPSESKATQSARWRGRALGAVVAMALIASACGGADAVSTTESGAAPAGSDTPESSDFPQFSAATIEGAQLDFGSLEGQDALLWFWAPW